MIKILNESNVTVTYNDKKVGLWIENVLNAENCETGDIEIVLLSNKEITNVNTEFLNHSYPTDVISFGDIKKSKVFGSIYIGIEVVKENSILHNVSFENELFRVIIHGVLHLAGYEDETISQKSNMRRLEDKYLEIIYR